MTRVRHGADWTLAAIVLVHLAVNVLHGRAHLGAQVPLSAAATLFVYIVILAGPLAGLAVSRWRPIAGGSIVAASLGGALVFGLINHFIVAGPDTRRPRRSGLADAVHRHRGAAARHRSRGRRDWRVVRGAPRREDIMNVFLAGGSGAIGVPIVRALVAGGHQVAALTRSAANEPMLRALGATPAVADALDAEALRRVVVEARPTHVIHQLTALPKGGPRSARDLVPTNRLRIDGTRNLVDAAVAAGAKRFIVGSFALMGGAEFGIPAEAQPAADAVRSMESRVLDASAGGLFDGVVLRYGLFYGPENSMTQQMIALARRRFLPTIRGDRGLLPLFTSTTRPARRSPRSTMAVPGASTTSSMTVR